MAEFLQYAKYLNRILTKEDMKMANKGVVKYST
jgi:hypothetical protein